jgi:hypothetical protein
MSSVDELTEERIKAVGVEQIEHVQWLYEAQLSLQ